MRALQRHKKYQRGQMRLIQGDLLNSSSAGNYSTNRDSTGNLRLNWLGRLS